MGKKHRSAQILTRSEPEQAPSQGFPLVQRRTDSQTYALEGKWVASVRIPHPYSPALPPPQESFDEKEHGDDEQTLADVVVEANRNLLVGYPLRHVGSVNFPFS